MSHFKNYPTKNHIENPIFFREYQRFHISNIEKTRAKDTMSFCFTAPHSIVPLPVRPSLLPASPPQQRPRRPYPRPLCIGRRVAPLAPPPPPSQEGAWDSARHPPDFGPARPCSTKSRRVLRSNPRHPPRASPSITEHHPGAQRLRSRLMAIWEISTFGVPRLSVSRSRHQPQTPGIHVL